ncbi:GH32 C-terminal domain-containing protein, partial [Psychrobacter sp. S1-30-MNA-CIBAN-0213]|uniref:GH32 C-terminal domain-containing protein n=2 Tax=Psychrobacter TaxID=497 RepID=UPI003332B234
QLFASSEAEQEINVAASNTTTTDISFDFSNEEYVFNNNSPLEHNQQSSNTDSFNNYHSYNLNEDLNEDLNLELDSNHIEHTN